MSFFMKTSKPSDPSFDKNKIVGLAVIGAMVALKPTAVAILAFQSFKKMADAWISLHRPTIFSVEKQRLTSKFGWAGACTGLTLILLKEETQIHFHPLNPSPSSTA